MKFYFRSVRDPKYLEGKIYQNFSFFQNLYKKHNDLKISFELSALLFIPTIFM